MWGGGCRKECPSYCIDHHCHPNNGTCIWGCSSNNCLSNECSNGGLCTKGCRKGQAGLLCNKSKYFVRLTWIWVNNIYNIKQNKIKQKKCEKNGDKNYKQNLLNVSNIKYTEHITWSRYRNLESMLRQLFLQSSRIIYILNIESLCHWIAYGSAFLEDKKKTWE